MNRNPTTLRLAGIVVSLAVGAASAGCGGARAEPAPAAAGPATSAAQAAEVQSAYDRVNNDVNQAFDGNGLGRIESPPLLIASRAWLRIKQRQKQPVPLTVHKDAKFLVPAGGDFPRWFVSVSTAIRGGAPAARPAYTVFVQLNQQAPWLAAYVVTPMDPVPPAATNSAGAATTVTDATDLVLDPAAVSAAIFDQYTTGATKDQFARTAALDDQLGAGYRVGVQMFIARGWAFVRTLDKSTHPAYALRTRDGGAVAFTASVVTDVVRPAGGKGTVALDGGSNEAALAGRPDGVTAKQFTIQRLQTFLTYIPPRASGQQLRVLAYNDTPVSVR